MEKTPTLQDLEVKFFKELLNTSDSFLKQNAEVLYDLTKDEPMKIVSFITWVSANYISKNLNLCIEKFIREKHKKEAFGIMVSQINEILTTSFNNNIKMENINVSANTH